MTPYIYEVKEIGGNGAREGRTREIVRVIGELVTVVTGVTLPSREQRYPFGALEVGERFDFQLHDSAAVRSAAQWVGKKLARKFSVRKDRERGIGVCIRLS